MDHDKHNHNNSEDQNEHGHREHHKMMVKDFRRRFWISLVLSLPVLALSPLIQEWLGFSLGFTGDTYVIFLLAVVVFFYGGWPFLSGFWDEMKKRQPGMMTLVAVAITVAFGYSIAVLLGVPGHTLLWELVSLIDVMLLGHWIEMRSVLGASRALEELAELLPSTAHRVRDDGTVEDVPLSDINVGDRIRIKPGEKVPTDGEIISGVSSINEAMITGESRAVEKSEGDEVIGGSINGEGSLEIQVKNVGEDTYLSQITELVRNAQAQKSRTQHLADRAARWLTLVAISAGVITLFGWMLFSSQPFSYALQRTIAVVVIACPHALGLAIPLVVSFSSTLSAKNGLLIRDRTAFESARDIDAVVFDKTGTLTYGTFSVTDVVETNGYVRDEIINFAGAVEAHSEHPIARAIEDAATRVSPVENFEAIPGKGAVASVGSKRVHVVSRGFLAEENISTDGIEDQLAAEGKTLAFVLVDGELAGVIGLDDTVREESKQAIAKLKAMNITPIMLTGDISEVAERIAEKLEIDEYVAQVRPDEKEDTIQDIKSRYRRVAMVGDGVNDAPALARADVGIAIGAGTDVAIEAADIVLVRDNPMDVVSVIDLAQKTYRKMVQNLWWAAGYNIVALPLAAGVLVSYGIVLSPAVAALLMSLSTVIVAVNATLLKRASIV